MLPSRQNMIESARRRLRPRALVLPLGFLLSFSGVAAAQRSVMVDELTASEVAAAIAGGKTTVIFDAGGVQSFDYGEWGDAVVTGQHNLVATYVARRVAETLGNALAFKAFPYNIHSDRDLRGTVSLKEDTFAAILRDFVRSTARMGFKSIVLLGDHGGPSQNVLKKVAEESDAEWSARGARVFFFPVYDDAKVEMAKYVSKLDGPEPCRQGQQGRPQTTCHTAVDDASEALFLEKDGARKDKLPPTVAGLVTPDVGKALIELKVTLAVEYIRRAVGGSKSQ